MLKAVVAATAAVTIAGSTVSYAQRSERPDDARRGQSTTEDMRAFQAARLAALRAGLSMSADQEMHWPAFEQAMRELQQLRLNRVAAMRDARRGDRAQIVDPAERMRQRASRLSENGAVLKRLAEATEPLYQSFDEAQRRRFAILTRTESLPGWQRLGRHAAEPRRQRGWRRKDAAATGIAPPDGAPAVFAHKTVDGDLFAQTWVSKTLDGVLIGRVFGAKTASGDLAVGELVILSGKSPFSGKTLEGFAAGDGLAALDPGAFGQKQTSAEGAAFGRKITIGEPPIFGRKVTSI
jgi:LTXXQ motif family protein